MNILKTIMILASLLFFLSFGLNAQDGISYTVNDLKLWSKALLKYKINDKWIIGLENQHRLKSNISVMEKNLTELTVIRKFEKGFSAALTYRYILNNDTEGNVQGLENFYRWNTDLGYKFDIKRFEMSTRLRFQSKKEFGSDNESDRTVRLKLGTEYNIRKWKFDPQFSVELFNGLTDSEGLNRLFLTLGTDYKMKNAGKISAYYRIDKILIGAYPATNYILGIGYQYTLKRK